MNIFTSLSTYTRVELEKLVRVPTQIITPQANKPVIGGIMDTILGASHITLDGVKVSFNELVEILGKVRSYKGGIDIEPIEVVNGVPYYDGKDVISLIMPRINYKKRGENSTDNVKIVKGKWMNGIAKKDIIGGTSGGLIHVLANDMGVYKTADFLNDIQRVADIHLLNSGFSVSLGDCILEKKERKEIRNILAKAKSQVNSFINFTHNKVKNSANILREEYENKIFATLNKAREEGGKLAREHLSMLNGLNFMVNTGSKGNYINICQITSAVGQQSINGDNGQGRVPFGLEYRTTPHFNKFDDGPESRGFISHSYLEGLEPHEFFFHMMAKSTGHNSKH